MPDPLREYRERRAFDRTDEPAGGDVRRSDEAPLFVIQHHDASTEHWDLRLEVDGVLVSWAVPKGPSTDPREKRLAKRTEDHPLEYADFEGRIPEDEYGGGEVVVWDLGPYRNDTTDDDGAVIPVADALADGHVRVWLDGQKLQGGYALTHTAMRSDDDWLLVKVDDEHADARRNPTSTEPASVLSGRTVEEVAEEDDAEDDPGEGDGAS